MVITLADGRPQSSSISIRWQTKCLKTTGLVQLQLPGLAFTGLTVRSSTDPDLRSALQTPGRLTIGIVVAGVIADSRSPASKALIRLAAI